MFTAGNVIVHNETRLKATVLHVNIELVTIVSHYVNAIPQIVPKSVVAREYDVLNEGAGTQLSLDLYEVVKGKENE